MLVMLLLSTFAWGQDDLLLFHGNRLLEGQADTFTERGVGAPTVAWDPVQERYLMFFETQTGDPSDACPEGEWSIGLAYSDVENQSYTLYPDPIVKPQPDTPWSCYAAHPAVVRDTDGTLHLWFKAGQKRDTCESEDPDDWPSWGCEEPPDHVTNPNMEPGIGKVTGIANVLPDVDDLTAAAQAELATIQQQQDLELDALAATLATLFDQLSEAAPLQCHDDYPAICAPCSEITLEATFDGSGGIDARNFCQPFEAELPRELQVLAGDAGGASHNPSFIRLDDQVDCRYRPNRELLEYQAIAECDSPVGAYSIELELNDTATAALTARAPIRAANAHTQTLQGPDVDRLNGLRDAAVHGDLGGVFAQQVAVDEVIDSLHGWLDTQPPSVETAQLQADLEDAKADLDAHFQALKSLADASAAQQARFDALEDYEPGVEFEPAANMLAVTAFRAAYPSVAKIGDDWKMVYAQRGNLIGTSSVDGENWATGETVLSRNLAPWAETELYSPSLNCKDIGADRFPITFGGRTNLSPVPGATVAVRRVGRAFSSNFTHWFWNAIQDIPPAGDKDDVVRHLEVLAYDSGARWFWFSHRDASGPYIGSGSIGGISIDQPASVGRVCE